MGLTETERLEIERALDRHIRLLQEELEYIHRRQAKDTNPGEPPRYMYVEAWILERIGDASSALQKIRKPK